MALIIKKITCTLVFTGEDPIQASSEPRFLDWATQQQFEAAVGGNLEKVQVYSNPQISQWLNDLRADAAASGNNIFIREGKFETETAEGRGLLAHELTHVSQNCSDVPAATGGEELEKEALENERRIRRGTKVRGFSRFQKGLHQGPGKGLHLAARDRSLGPRVGDTHDRAEVEWGDGSVSELGPGDLEKAFQEAARKLEGASYEF